MVKNETYLIEGMSCASCAAHIEEGLKQVDNLSDVNVHFATSKLISLLMFLVLKSEHLY